LSYKKRRIEKRKFQECEDGVEQRTPEACRQQGKVTGVSCRPTLPTARLAQDAGGIAVQKILEREYRNAIYNILIF
jgi:hypothetical protein